MNESPRLVEFASLRMRERGRTTLWVTPSVADIVTRTLELDASDTTEPLPDELDTLVVVGGGTLIDRAKFAARNRPTPIQLVAIPSIWGSGAEASPIVVLDDRGHKTVHVDPVFLPDERVVWAELAATIPLPLARAACGDAMTHAFEGLISPLADDAVRAELGDVLRTMIDLPLAADPRWFEVSARASAGQARAGVGLVHGIAHVIEAPLRAAHPDGGWGHARLCATYLAPVMRFDLATFEEVDARLTARGLDVACLLAAADDLHDEGIFRETLPVLEAHWKSVLRDPCTRMNGALVRPDTIKHFLTSA